MTKLTYQQAYDLIIQAYFKDEIKPWNHKFCFCGTLCNGNKWKGTLEMVQAGFHNDHSGYTGRELYKMEAALLNAICKPSDEEYEDKLFRGMCAALEVLKEIHRERGENVDDLPMLTKRQLKVA